ncbi:ABC transporter ATP-binding protein [Pueribacillus sp. YX66]|uniref:ABC transporter ATP-binding protein n=1 Tax=Pueribacillus sp. YX66 TaxID=3229242 RepID=UPI00358D4957
MSKLIHLDKVNAYYGQAHILHGVSLEVKEGEVVCLLGRNGVGKTTSLKSIMGLVNVKKGGIYFQQEEITNHTPHDIFKKNAIGYVPEDRRIFASLSVRENLMIGQLNAPKNRRWDINKVFEMFPVLKEKQNRSGAYLSGGEQQMLAIARCLMGDPKIMMLDEPCEGLAPIVVQELEESIKKLHQEGMTMILVEQSLRLAKTLGDRVYIMNKGEITYSGDRESLLNDSSLVSELMGIG